MSRSLLVLFTISATVLGLIISFERLVNSDSLVQTLPPAWPSSNLHNIPNGTTAPPALTDLSVTKSDTPDPVSVMTPLTYTVTISNQEVVEAENVVLIDALPLSVIYGSALPSQGSCNQAALIVLCSLGGISGQSLVTVTIVVTPTVAEELINRAYIVSETPDVDPTNNRAEESTQVAPSAAPSIKVYLPIILNFSR